MMERKCIRAHQRLLFMVVLAIFVLGMGLFIGCSSGNDPQTGTFVDSPVSGLNYTTVNNSGTTNANGGFTYYSGETVSFSIGNLILGSAAAKATITPLDIVSGASGITDQRVSNICRLLQTLDEDGDLNNGIRINAKTADIVSATAAGLNFNQTASAFSADAKIVALLAALNLNNAAGFTSAEANGRTLRSADDAQAHMTAATSDRKTVATMYGSVRGFAIDDTWVWRGIPFAKPPVGDLRWKAPADPEAWTAVREATSSCSECTQQVSDKFWRSSPGVFTGSEDCLYLDIYRPKTDTTNLPVFVWIHGGANTIGSAKIYNGSALAKRGNIIVVIVQYRLGVLGWMTHPALRASAATTDDQSGNYATLDHLKALTWVKNNIANFGGDPGNVTVGGQSAGGHNTMNLFITPKTDVLFKGAFAESPALSQLMPLKTQAAGDTVTNSLIDWLLVDDGHAADTSTAATLRGNMSNAEIVTYLRGKTVSKILQAALGGPGAGATMPIPTAFMDGNVMPTTSWLETITAGNFKKVPLIIGTTQYEYKDLMTLYGNLLKTYLGVPSGSYSWDNLYDVLNGTMTFDQVLPTEDDKEAFEQSGLLKSRKWQADCHAIARAVKANSANNTVYSYLFTWSGGGDPALADFKKIFGGSHAQDVPFFFGKDTDLFGYSFTTANRAGRMALQEAMMDYLLAFIKTGDPNPSGSSLLNWTQWSNTDGADKFIKFDADLNDYILSMDSAEATTAVVTAEITAVLGAHAGFGNLFYMLGIYP